VAAERSFRRLLLEQLVRWFKADFFQWTNTLPCGRCAGRDTEAVGGTQPTAVERAGGGASVVELHRCRGCGFMTRFPRYNNPALLLDWRKGRCGEWANCFTLCALAAGFEARHVSDWTDHVWTEVWLPDAGPGAGDRAGGRAEGGGALQLLASSGTGTGSGTSSGASSGGGGSVGTRVAGWPRGRWLHVDACEAAVDAPLLYEAGWGKQLSLIVAVGRDEVAHVSQRYTKQWVAAVRPRIENTLGPVAALGQLIDVANAAHSASAVPAPDPLGGSGRRRFVAWRQRVDARCMEAACAFDDRVRKEEEQVGRITGSMAWRLERGEAGVGAPGAPAAATATDPASALLRDVSATSTGALAGSASAAGGWALLEEKVTATSVPGETMTSFSSWGKIAVALFDSAPDACSMRRQRVQWLLLPTVPVSPAAKISEADADADAKPKASSRWKALAMDHVPSASAFSSSSESAAWPSEKLTMRAVAAVPMSQKFLVLCSSTAETPVLTLWEVSPQPGTRVWRATAFGSGPPEAVHPHHACYGLTMHHENGKTCIIALVGNRLWRQWCGNSTDSWVSVSQTTSTVFAVTSYSQKGLLLSVGDRTHVSLLVSVPDASSAHVLEPALAPASTFTGWRISAPRFLELSGMESSKNGVDFRLEWNFCSLATAERNLAWEEPLWCAFCQIGLPVPSAVPLAVDLPPQPWVASDEYKSMGQAIISVPRGALPTPGVYQVMLMRGTQFVSPLAKSSSFTLAYYKQQAVIEVPLVPGMGIVHVTNSADSTGLLAVTKTGDLWTFRHNKEFLDGF
jgi:hypothetical protein